MEAPKQITFGHWNGKWSMGNCDYIRADLVTALLPYAKHHMTCAWHVGHIDGECTCGLTKIKEDLK